MNKRLAASALLLLLLVAVNGCFLASTREINLLVVRTDSGGSEVTVTYRVPPPKAGNVYVLWLVNADQGKQLRVGTVEPSSRLRAIKTTVGFWATGAVVSIESSAEVDQMSNTWALVSGQISANPQSSPSVPVK